MKFKGDIIITDPCYIIKKKNQLTEDDWDTCKYGKNFESLGINTYMSNETYYGDWSCTTYEKKTKKVLGKFCADAGRVAIFLLEEVLKYNPNFDYHLNKPWTTTLIKDFDGDIQFDIKMGKYFNVLKVVGKGNINFFTKQTGC